MEAEMNAKEIKKVLDGHRQWLNNDGSKHADLQDANLRHANLRGADLPNYQEQRIFY